MRLVHEYLSLPALVDQIADVDAAGLSNYITLAHLREIIAKGTAYPANTKKGLPPGVSSSPIDDDFKNERLFHHLKGALTTFSGYVELVEYRLSEGEGNEFESDKVLCMYFNFHFF